MGKSGTTLYPFRKEVNNERSGQYKFTGSITTRLTSTKIFVNIAKKKA
jgi:hypothetical protein